MKLHLIELTQTTIYEQLLLEEALLRADERSFCVINYGAPRAIVMGLSGIPEELIQLEHAARDKIPVHKRYSGGGTVIVDEQTLFISFIIAKKDLDIIAYPEPILRWSFDLYQKAWNLPNFSLHENDYAIGERKCGGNAQYLRKDRWMHHTSFLWDYQEKNMEYLLLPKKRPAYRLDRSHNDFLCKLKEFTSLETLVKNLKAELVKRFYIERVSPEELKEIQSRSYRIGTHSLDL